MPFLKFLKGVWGELLSRSSSQSLPHKLQFEILSKYYTTIPKRNQVPWDEFNHRFALSVIRPQKSRNLLHFQ